MTLSQYLGALLAFFAFCGLVLTVAEILRRRARRREEQITEDQMQCEAERQYRKICEQVEREVMGIVKNCKGRR